MGRSVGKLVALGGRPCYKNEQRKFLAKEVRREKKATIRMVGTAYSFIFYMFFFVRERCAQKCDLAYRRWHGAANSWFSYLLSKVLEWR